MAARFADSYAEAIRFLEEAAEAIDQAHACMKDAGIEGIEIATGLHAIERYTGIRALSARVAAMAAEVRTAECGECGRALSGHGEEDGACEPRRPPAKIRQAA